MLTTPKKKKVDRKHDRQNQVVRPHIVERGKLLAKDPEYPDSNILKKIAKKLASEKFTH